MKTSFKNLCVAQKEEYRQLLSVYIRNVAQRAESIVSEIEMETDIDIELSEKFIEKQHIWE